MNLKLGLKFVVLILILSIALTQVGYLFSPEMASAQSGVTGFLRCTGTGAFLSGLINQGLQFLSSQLTSIFGSLFGLSGFGGSVPVADSGVRKSTGTNVTKETVADTIARCLAREILTSITRTALDVIRNGGRSGGPSYVRNWRNFQTDAQYRGEDVFRSILASTDLCSHFSEELRSLFNASQAGQLTGQNTRVNNTDPYQLRAGCTLPRDFDIDAFSQNPAANGGWEAFLRLQQPQNNIYGQISMALGELDNQRQIEESGDLYESLGHGFTSVRDGCLVQGLNGRCVVYRDVLTPGSILGAATAGTIEAEFNWVTSADEINELIAVAIGALFNRIRNLSSADEGLLDIPDTNVNIIVNPLPGGDPTPTPQLAEVTLFFDPGLVGPGEVFKADDPDLTNNIKIKNNSASSAKVNFPHTVAILYTNVDFGGEALLLTVDLPLLPPNFDDAVSSLKVLPANGVTLCPFDEYRDGNFVTGPAPCELFTGDDPDLRDNSIPDNSASSIIVPPGWQVQLCPNANFTGGCELFPISDPNFGNNIIGHDRTSSIKIIASPQPSPSSSPQPPAPPAPPGGVCASQNTVADHQSDLQQAISDVNTANPSGVADELNGAPESFAYLLEVIDVLESRGFNGSITVLDTNDNPNSGGLLAVWVDGDTTIERYEVIPNAGTRSDVIRDVATANNFEGDVPLSCTF